ncbi:MAG: hypothetical protein KDB00_14105, partial [Planctomycetales bacterium]|nr:hypothetical protein [Planctomycetales bacterium]
MYDSFFTDRNRSKSSSRRRKTKSRRALFQSLEPRIVLDADAANVIAHFQGQISSEQPSQTIPFAVRAGDFQSSRGTQVLGFRVDAAHGSSLDPSAGLVRDAQGNLYPLNYARNSLSASDSASVVVAELPPGDYTFEVTAEQGTIGEFDVSVFLAGDINGDGQVYLDDRTLLINLLRGRSYAIEADVNLDGYLTSFDSGHLLRNLGVTTNVTPLDLAAELAPPAEVTLADGTSLTALVDHTISVATNPNARVQLDLDSDGIFDVEGTADGAGAFAASMALAEGPNSITVQSSDSFGQQRRAVIDVVLDTTAPNLSLQLAPESDSAPTGDQATTFEIVSLIGATEPGLTVTLYRDGDLSQSIRAATADSAGQIAFSDLPLLLGENLFTATVVDVVGNASQANLLVTRLPTDVTPPAISLRLISDTGVSSTDRITRVADVIATITDEHAIASLTATIDSSAAVDVTSLLEPNGSLLLDGATLAAFGGGVLADGTHTLRLSATDAFGNSAEQSLAFSLDTTPPVVSIATPTNNQITNTAVTVSGQVDDLVAGVSLLEARHDGGDFFTVGFDGAGQYTFDSTAAGADADGTHTFTLLATDVAGNASPLESVTYVLDTIAPTGTAQLAAASDTGVLGDGATRLSSVSIDVQTEPHSWVTLLADGRQGQADAAGSITFEDVPLDDGDNTIPFELRDAAGNRTVVTAVVNLDRTAPAIPVIELALNSDTGAIGDFITERRFVTLIGQSDPNVSIRFDVLNRVLETGDSGTFEASAIPLEFGENEITVFAEDSTGNQVSTNVTVKNVAPSDWLLLEESTDGVVEQSQTVVASELAGASTLSFDVRMDLDSADQTVSTEDLFLVYFVNKSNPSQTLVDRGTPGTALFQLSGANVEFATGLVTFNGTTVQIDAAGLPGGVDGEIRFQLINQDHDTGTSVAISPIIVDSGSERNGAVPFSNPTDVVPIGDALDIGELLPNSELSSIISNVRLDHATGRYVAELQVRIDGPDTGRLIAVVLKNLPNGVSVQSPSGFDATGNPYLSFRRAISRGGLRSGQTSQPVLLEITNPTLVPFAMNVESFSGHSNAPPVLASIGPLSMNPGANVQVQLIANDSDGDPIDFFLRSNQRLPNVSLDGNRLSIAPLPGDEGSYEFTVLAFDGADEVSETVTLDVVSDSMDTTRISGVVLSTSQTPLAGVPVTLGRLTVTTDSAGRFELTLPPHLMPTESFDVEVPLGDVYFDPFSTGAEVIEFRRAQYDTQTGTGSSNPRRHPNLVSSFLDGSIIYGSDQSRSDALRLFDGSGQLKTSPGELLPLNNETYFPDGLLENDVAGIVDPTQTFVAGDVRSSENPVLTSLHTVLLREHNRLAAEIGSDDPLLSGDEIFELARRQVIAQIQHITYSEYLPLLLGNGSIAPYQGYDPALQPGIGALFTTAAFRIGHSQSSATIERVDQDGNALDPIGLREAFFNTGLILNDGIDSLLRGAANQISEEIDTQVIDEIRNFLFGPPGSGGMDLAAMGIQRGRDLGLPSYNQARIEFGLPPVSDFDGITASVSIQDNLRSVYGSVENIDVFVGGLAEDHVVGSMVGELFQTVIAKQYELIRDSDRFWYENGQFTENELVEIRSTTLSGLIQRNSGITNLPANVFSTSQSPASLVPTGTVASQTSTDFRSLDGSGNNTANPQWGSTGSHLLVDASLNYGDGVSTPAGQDRPSARAISNGVMAQTQPTAGASDATALFVFWGQLLAHDLSHTPTGIPDSLQFHGEDVQVQDKAYPYVAEPVDLLLEHPVLQGINNQIGRPIYLPELDLGQAVNIDPNVNTTVSVTLRPGEVPVTLQVAAGTLRDRNGNLFDGQLSITEVPPELTPAALPKNLLPDTVITIQPAGFEFDTPAPITFPNRAGWPAGTILDLWSIDHETGEFAVAGQQRVSADGTRIETISGGIRSSSWHLPLPVPDPPTPDPLPGPLDGCPNISCGLSFTSNVDPLTGGVVETHDLVTYQSLGDDRGLVLVYDSLRADPRPIIPVGYDNARLGNRAGMYAEVTAENLGQSLSVRGYWQLVSDGNPGPNPNIPVTDANGAVQLDLSQWPSGQIPYTVTVGLGQLADSPEDRLFTGSTVSDDRTLAHVNLIDSPLGSGWSFAEIEEIVVNDDGSALLINGNGNAINFAQSKAQDGSFVSPPGDFSVLHREPDGRFVRTLLNQTVSRFNLNHQLVEVEDRNGLLTRYEYDSQRRLTKKIDPVGLETTLVYEPNRITITDPADHVTVLDLDPSGNLTTITDPDQSSRVFRYDDRHHMIGETDQGGNSETAFYDQFGRATHAIRKDGTEIRINPFQTTLEISQGETSFFDFDLSPALFTPLGTAGFQAPQSQYADANGNVSQSDLNPLGLPTQQVDAIGSLGSTVYNDSNLPTRVIDAFGNAQTFRYDDRGNVIETWDAESKIQTWVGSGTGDWNVPSNWSNGRVPGPDDYVLLGTDEGPLTIEVGTAGINVRAVEFGSPKSSVTLNLFRGTLTVREGGTLSSGSRINVYGNSGIDGPFINSGSIRIAGFSGRGRAALSLADATQFENRGLIQLTNDTTQRTSLDATLAATTGTLTNGPEGTIEILSGLGAGNRSIGAKVVNQGTFR